MNSPMIREILIPRVASVAETIVHQVAQLAIEGKIKPGEKFPSEAELAESWKVARSSIREAFAVFQTLGVTAAKPGRGTILISTAPLFALIDWSHFTRAELITDIIEARLALEPIIAAMAARRADAEDIRKHQEIRSRPAMARWATRTPASRPRWISTPRSPRRRATRHCCWSPDCCAAFTCRRRA